MLYNVKTFWKYIIAIDKDSKFSKKFLNTHLFRTKLKSSFPLKILHVVQSLQKCKYNILVLEKTTWHFKTYLAVTLLPPCSLVPAKFGKVKPKRGYKILDKMHIVPFQKNINVIFYNKNEILWRRFVLFCEIHVFGKLFFPKIFPSVFSVGKLANK